MGEKVVPLLFSGRHDKSILRLWPPDDETGKVSTTAKVQPMKQTR